MRRGFWVFLLAPFLDVRFRRRTYALFFGLLAVIATAFTGRYHTSKMEIEAVMTTGFLLLALYDAAVGGPAPWSRKARTSNSTPEISAQPTVVEAK